MVRTIVYISMYTDNRESSKDTRFHCLFDTFANCWDVFFRNCTTDNSRFKFVYFLTVDIHWLEFNFTVSVLSTSTGLFCIFAVDIHCFCDGFFVSNLWSTYIRFYFEFTQKSVYDDLKVKLTHTGNDCLTSFLICMRTECRIFFCKFCKRFSKFTLRSFCLRLDRELDNWLWEFHGL